MKLYVVGGTGSDIYDSWQPWTYWLSRDKAIKEIQRLEAIKRRIQDTPDTYNWPGHPLRRSLGNEGYLDRFTFDMEAVETED